MAKNSLILFGFFLLQQFLVLIQLKILTNWLNKEYLGEYFTLLAIAAILSIFMQLGLPLVITRFIAKYEALSKSLRSKRLVLFSWMVVLFSGIVFLFLTILFSSKVLNLIYKVPPSSYLLTWAILLNVVISFKAITYSAFYGLQKMEFPAIAEGSIALTVVFLLFLFRFQLSILNVFQINIFANLALSILFSLFLIFSLKKKSEDISQEKGLLADIRTFWLGAALTSFLSIALNYADQILISLVLSFSSVAIFYLAVKVVYLSRHIIAIPLDALSPEITGKWELNQKENLQENLRFFAKMIFILAVLLATVTLALAQPIIYLISNQQFKESILLLYILVLALPLIAIFSPINYFLRAIGKINYSLLADFIWLFGYLICGFLFLKLKGLFGLAGAFFVVSLFLAIFNYQRVKRFIFWKIEKMFSILLCGLIVTSVTLILTKILLIPNIPKLLIGLGIALVGYNLLIVRGKVISRDDRQRLLNLTSNQSLRKLILLLLTWPLGEKSKI
ncbi:MAG: lipopolysaccharide biosynthesis protein [candidate division Zixibacteria bacterium]|nr:lipopolysaccharide biosynthesis protein [candidate division Zixibacteria bacterium]